MKLIRIIELIIQRNLFIKESALITVSFLFLIVLTGCKVDLDVWVDNSGGGKGTMTISGVPITEAELRSKLMQKGIEVVSVINKDFGVEASIKWTDFNKSFGTRKVNQDSSILLDFGNVELGSVTAHVDGKIDQGQTKGNFRDPSTVVFTSGRAKLVYMPNKSFKIPPVVLGILGVLAAIGIVVFFVKKSPKSIGQPTAQTEQTYPKEVATNDTTSEKKFCRSCGTQLEPADAFCTNCGKQRV